MNNTQADFREGQWEAIASLIEERSKLLVVERTGWGKSLVYTECENTWAKTKNASWLFSQEN
ncbi:MAG: hypothetical protein ACM65L_23100 [Microcoleus sp.]